MGKKFIIPENLWFSTYRYPCKVRLERMKQIRLVRKEDVLNVKLIAIDQKGALCTNIVIRAKCALLKKIRLVRQSDVLNC